MDVSSFEADILPALRECRNLLIEASQKLGERNTVVLVESEGMFDHLVSAFHRIVRKLPKNRPIDLIIDSDGGSIDAASAIASLCRGRCTTFRTIVPFMAKSAATLLALAADERILTCSAQLGPVDPQVRHPEKRLWFPAHSIKEALERVEATQDPIVKMAMADKLDPFLIGAYQDAISASKQYIEEIVQGWSVANKEAIVSAFIDRYRSHGYPIDVKVVEELGIPYKSVDEETENLICDLHEKCMDILDDMESDGSIIMTAETYFFRTGDFKATDSFIKNSPRVADKAKPVGTVSP